MNDGMAVVVAWNYLWTAAAAVQTHRMMNRRPMVGPFDFAVIPRASEAIHSSFDQNTNNNTPFWRWQATEIMLQ